MQSGIIRIRDRVGDSLELWLASLTAHTSRRSRLAGATVLALGMHALLFWVLVATHPEIWNIDSRFVDDAYTPVELWPDEPWKVPPVLEPRLVPVEPVVVPREVQPVQDQPQQTQTEDQAPREADVAPPAPQPVPQPVVQPQPVKSITVNIPKEMPLDMTGPVTVSDVPAPPSISTRVKKKTQEELEAQAKDNQIGQASDLNLHEAANINIPALQKVAPSGLAPANGGGGGGGRLGSMTPPAGLPGGTGTLNGGRGQVTQALQNHDWCVATQKTGKPLPADCQMTDLAGQQGMGPKPDADLQAAVAKKDQTLRYKTSAGNSAYWNRVTHVPTAADQRDQAPQSGAYSNAKDQRNMGNGGGTADPQNQ